MTPAQPLRQLITARLHLLPLTAQHAGAMFTVLSDPAIYEFENSPPPSYEWLQQRYARLESRASADGSEQWLNWVAERDNRLLGYVQASIYPDRTALIAYEFASVHWGQGYAHEAVAAMLDELAASYGVTVAGAVFKRPNFRSRKLLQRLGMAPVEGDAFPAPLAADDEDAMAKTLARL